MFLHYEIVLWPKTFTIYLSFRMFVEQLMHHSTSDSIYHFIIVCPEIEISFNQILISIQIPDFTNLTLLDNCRFFLIIPKPKHYLFMFHTLAEISLMKHFLPSVNICWNQRYFLISFDLSFSKYELPHIYDVFKLS